MAIFNLDKSRKRLESYWGIYGISGSAENSGLRKRECKQSWTNNSKCLWVIPLGSCHENDTPYGSSPLSNTQYPKYQVMERTPPDVWYHVGPTTSGPDTGLAFWKIMSFASLSCLSKMKSVLIKGKAQVDPSEAESLQSSGSFQIFA